MIYYFHYFWCIHPDVNSVFKVLYLHENTFVVTEAGKCVSLRVCGFAHAHNYVNAA